MGCTGERIDLVADVEHKQIKRNQSIDAYRCLLMFGICALHAVTQGGHNAPWMANCLTWCVTGFAFLSGWFGIRFKYWKVVKLYAVSFYCAAIVFAFNFAFGMSSGARDVLNIATGQWYLNAYAVLMCFAPILNEGCRALSEKFATDRMAATKLATPLVLCAFGWSFATTLPVVKGYIPKPVGLASYSFLTLIGAYCAARIWRECEIRCGELRIRNAHIVVFLLLSVVASAIGLNDYNSPFALAIAFGTFYLAKNAKECRFAGRVCSWLGPSMFSVYLLHSSGRTWWALAKCEDFLLGLGMPIVAVWGVTAFAVFTVCVAFDIPRRLFVGLLTQRSKRV